ncbi:unnamed protein product [Gordionus sp. m RMFG-2023]
MLDAKPKVTVKPKPVKVAKRAVKSGRMMSPELLALAEKIETLQSSDISNLKRVASRLSPEQIAMLRRKAAQLTPADWEALRRKLIQIKAETGITIPKKTKMELLKVIKKAKSKKGMAGSADSMAEMENVEGMEGKKTKSKKMMAGSGDSMAEMDNVGDMDGVTPIVPGKKRMRVAKREVKGDDKISRELIILAAKRKMLKHSDIATLKQVASTLTPEQKATLRRRAARLTPEDWEELRAKLLKMRAQTGQGASPKLSNVIRKAKAKEGMGAADIPIAEVLVGPDMTVKRKKPIVVKRQIVDSKSLDPTLMKKLKEMKPSDLAGIQEKISKLTPAQKKMLQEKAGNLTPEDLKSLKENFEKMQLKKGSVKSVSKRETKDSVHSPEFEALLMKLKSVNASNAAAIQKKIAMLTPEQKADLKARVSKLNSADLKALSKLRKESGITLSPKYQEELSKLKAAKSGKMSADKAAVKSVSKREVKDSVHSPEFEALLMKLKSVNASNAAAIQKKIAMLTPEQKADLKAKVSKLNSADMKALNELKEKSGITLSPKYQEAMKSMGKREVDDSAHSPEFKALLMKLKSVNASNAAAIQKKIAMLTPEQKADLKAKVSKLNKADLEALNKLKEKSGITLSPKYQEALDKMKAAKSGKMSPPDETAAKSKGKRETKDIVQSPEFTALLKKLKSLQLSDAAAIQEKIGMLTPEQKADLKQKVSKLSSADMEALNKLKEESGITLPPKFQEELSKMKAAKAGKMSPSVGKDETKMTKSKKTKRAKKVSDDDDDATTDKSTKNVSLSPGYLLDLINKINTLKQIATSLQALTG